jgi:hypothetical protein
MDPVRLFMMKFTKLNLHEGELKKIVHKTEMATDAALNDLMAHDQGRYCGDFIEGVEKIQEGYEAARETLITMMDVANIENDEKDLGRTEANILDIKAAWNWVHALDKFQKAQWTCHMEHQDSDETDQATAEAFMEKNHHNIMEKSKYRSLNCYYRFLHNRVRYWELVTEKETQATIHQCQAAYEGLMLDRSQMIHTEGVDAKSSWTTPTSVKHFSEEDVSEHNEKMDQVISFLENWSAADDSLYDSTMKSAKRLGEAKEAAKNVMDTYYWYWNMGQSMMEHHHQDKSW